MCGGGCYLKKEINNEEIIMLKTVIKASGERESFNEQKLIRSLQKSGADQDSIDVVLGTIRNLPDESTTKKIYQQAFTLLKNRPRGVAARYSTKYALYGFGPAGYPFEKFIGRLFLARGYDVQNNQIVQGFCVSHEIDVIATKHDEHLIVECKFHNRAGIKSNVKVPLYVRARFEDIHKQLEKDQDHHKKFHGIVLVTNTKFTNDAIAYGNCAAVRLLGWSYPQQESLMHLIEKYHMHPITSLTSLNMKQKQILLDQGIVLCSDLEKNRKLLDRIESNPMRKNRILKEAEETCGFAHRD
jgi:hypothetical protein